MSFSGTVFHALSLGVIHIVRSVSFKNLKMEVFDWLLKNFNQREVSRPNTPNKMNHTMWKSMKNCARKWYCKLCAFLFKVTCAFWKMWTDYRIENCDLTCHSNSSQYKQLLLLPTDNKERMSTSKPPPSYPWRRRPMGAPPLPPPQPRWKAPQHKRSNRHVIQKTTNNQPQVNNLRIKAQTNPPQVDRYRKCKTWSYKTAVSNESIYFAVFRILQEEGKTTGAWF